MDYNVFDSYICQQLEEDAIELIQDLLDKKLEHFRSLDKDEKADLLAKSPNYCYEVQYNEWVKLDECRRVKLATWFQNLADQYGLRKREGSRLVVKDEAIVNHFASLWTSYIKGQSKGKVKCNWAVGMFNDKPVFMTPERGIEIRFGGTTAQDMLKEKRAKAGKPEVSAEERQAKEIARLRAENAALASRTPVGEDVSSPVSEAPPVGATIN